MRYKVAQSGEVFYIHNNALCVADSVESMEKVIKVELIDRNTYFEYSIGSVNYKTLITNKAQISKHAKSMPIDKMLDLVDRYHREYNQYIARREAV